MSSKKSFLYICYGYGIESVIEKVFLGNDLLERDIYHIQIEYSGDFCSWLVFATQYSSK